MNLNDEPKIDGTYAPPHLSGKLNVNAELKRVRDLPLAPFLNYLYKNEIVEPDILHNPVRRFLDAYEFYYLSLERFLPESSIASRWFEGPYWVRKSGGTQRYSPSQRKIADKYNAISRYLEYDFWTSLIYARILLDRTIGLSHYFLPRSQQQPSFSSFNDHKKFFVRLTKQGKTFGDHEEYASYIRSNTDWFAMPLKAVRDKFLVHANAAPPHFYHFGYNGDGHLHLLLSIPKGFQHDPEDSEGTSQTPLWNIIVGIPQLSRQIEEFLRWYNEYALQSMGRNMTSPDTVQE
jgi:hypothetical protein